MRKLFRNRGQRGTALVETAIVAPLFCLLLFGVAEFGYLYEDTFTVQNMIREGARTAGAMGTQPGVDHYILESIGDAAKSLKGSKILSISVYLPNSTTGQPQVAACGSSSLPNDALAASPEGTFGKCSLYSQADIPGFSGPGRSVSDFGASTCSSSNSDFNFCPSSAARTNSYTGPANIGIYIRLSHKSLTGLLFNNQIIEKHVVVQLDPDPRLLPS